MATPGASLAPARSVASEGWDGVTKGVSEGWDGVSGVVSEGWGWSGQRGGYYSCWMVVWPGSVLKMAELVIGGWRKVADGMARGVIEGWGLRDQRGQ